MFRWFVINTYSGHENKVKANLEHRIVSMARGRVPPRRRADRAGDRDEGRPEGADREARPLPGYVLVNMDLNDDAWSVVKNTPGVTGFVGARQHAGAAVPARGRPHPAQRAPRSPTGSARRSSSLLASRSRSRAGRSRISTARSSTSIRTPQKLKVLVDIFERQVPVELEFDQVKKLGLKWRKKSWTLIKLQIPGGQANPAPPVGPALGQHGVNIMEFCKAFNAQTQQENGRITPVEITVYETARSRSSRRRRRPPS